MINSQIFITSLNKEIQKSKVYGKLDLTVLYFFNLLIYYIDYTEGVILLENHNKQLKELAYYLKYKYPDIICNYKLINSNEAVVGNQPPTVSDKTIDVDGSYKLEITKNDFITNYSDPENHIYKNVKIYPEEGLASGKLVYNNSIITNPIEIDLNSGFVITYTTNSYLDSLFGSFFNFTNIDGLNLEEINDMFTFRVSDNLDAYSNLQTINIINSEYVVNQQSEIGDVNIEVDNFVTTILNMDMFTTLMSPPYNDPENDLIDAIRIDNIQTTNQGQLLLNGISVQAGDIITREQINAEEFTHIGPNIDTISTDSFNFSARDEGSLIWVQ